MIAMIGFSVLSACAPAPTPDPTRTPIPSFTPPATVTPTASPSRTLTPTTTRTPEATGTRTPGPTQTTVPSEQPIPSLTAAIPLIQSDRYQLVNWSLMDTSRLIELLEAYPDANFKNKTSKSYYAAYRYALYAELEGLLRYPDSPQARLWQWDAAYNLAQIGDERAGPAYARLIERALNARQVDPEGLNGWFFDHEPRLSLRPVELDPIQGAIRTLLLAIENQGSAFLLLVETTDGYQIHSLATWFNFPSPQTFDFSVADLTGDGVDELVLYQVSAPEDDEPGFPFVYTLELSIEEPLPFNPAISFALNIDHNRIWIAPPNDLGYHDLVVKADVFPACPLEVAVGYRWNGSRFDPISTSYQLMIDPALVPFCESVPDHAAANWGPPAAIEILDQLLEVSLALEDASLPPALKDKWRFQLGLALALDGNFDRANIELEALQARPFDPGGRWRNEAANFLSVYQQPTQIYPACTTTDLCSAQEALAARISMFSSADYDLIVNQLGIENLPIRASGFYDFENDGKPERWFTFRHPGRIFLDLWILGEGPEQVVPLYVDQVDRAVPEFEYIQDSGDPPGVRLFFQKSFTVSRLPETGYPFLVPYKSSAMFTVDRIRETWESARDALLFGANPASIRQALLDLEAADNFICPYVTCQDFIFTLALASELSGDRTLAVENYHRLWLDYRNHPFTITARLKLVGESFVPTETPTPTRTPRPSRTPTVTPVVTATPEMTSTP